MTIRTTLLLLVPLTAVTTNASQKWELNLGYDGLDWADETSSAGRLQGRYFLDPLQLAGPEPLAEATFVERPRTFDLFVGLTELNIDYTDAYDYDLDSDETHFGFGYTHRRPTSPHAFSISYEYATVSESAVVWLAGPPQELLEEATADGDVHTLRLGYHYYLTPHITLGVEGSAERERFDPAYWDRDRYSLDLVGRWLHPLGGERWLALHGSIGRFETQNTVHRSDGSQTKFTFDGTNISLGLEFYLSRTTSLGISGEHENENNTDTLTATARHFFNEKVAVGLHIGRILPEYDEDGTTYGGALTVRF
jgi:hypothetical protein